MEQNPKRLRRRSIRLHGYDYGEAGGYFVTIVSKDRACSFGEVVDGEMRLNQVGHIIQTIWDELPVHFSNVECDAFVVMPNHVNGIITWMDDGVGGTSGVRVGFKPARGVAVGPNSARVGLKPAPTLSEVVRAFKTFSARRINEIRGTAGISVWQRNYYEHVVRTEDELHRIREYIASNPLQWQMDRENPLRKQIKTSVTPKPWEV